MYEKKISTYTKKIFFLTLLNLSLNFGIGKYYTCEKSTIKNKNIKKHR